MQGVIGLLDREELLHGWDVIVIKEATPKSS